MSPTLGLSVFICLKPQEIENKLRWKMGRRARQAAQRARDIKDLVTYWPLATAGTHFPGEGWQVRVEGVATGLPWRSLGSLCPSSGSGEQDGAGAGGVVSCLLPSIPRGSPTSPVGRAPEPGGVL